jgi:hypothetical protein
VVASLDTHVDLDVALADVVVATDAVIVAAVVTVVVAMASADSRPPVLASHAAWLYLLLESPVGALVPGIRHE